MTCTIPYGFPICSYRCNANVALQTQHLVQSQLSQKLTALQTEKNMQLAECQQLRKELQHQLQYIQQTLIQLDDKEAHLELLFQAVAQKIENH